MSKYIRMAVILIFSAFLALMPLASFNVYALDAKIAFSDPSVVVGNEVSVTLKISSLDGSNLGDATLLLKYDASYLEFIAGDNAQGGAGAIKVGAGEDGKTEWVYNLRFKALKAGSSKIELTSEEIYDVDKKAATISQKGSSTVTISSGAEVSNDTSLSSLSIADVKMSPEFDPNITEYTANVGEGVTLLRVSAVSAQANSIVEISGNTDLVDGENIVNVMVKAADGENTKIYTIKVNKGSEYGSSQGEQAGSLVQIFVEEMSINVLPIEDGVSVPSNLTETEIEINDVKVQGWIDKKDKGKNYAVVYASNEKGEKGFYTYDLQERTVQRYFISEVSGSGTAKLASKTETKGGLGSLLGYLIPVLIIVLAAAVVLLLLKKIKKKAKKKKYKDEDDGYMPSDGKTETEDFTNSRLALISDEPKKKEQEKELFLNFDEDEPDEEDEEEEEEEYEEEGFLDLDDSPNEHPKSKKKQLLDLDDDFDIIDL